MMAPDFTLARQAATYLHNNIYMNQRVLIALKIVKVEVEAEPGRGVQNECPASFIPYFSSISAFLCKECFYIRKCRENKKMFLGHPLRFNQQIWCLSPYIDIENRASISAVIVITYLAYEGAGNFFAQSVSH